MINDREEDTDALIFSFIYVHSTLSGNKGIFMDSKHKVVKSCYINCSYNSPELAI